MKFKNIQSDTSMRDAIAEDDDGSQAGRSQE